MADAKPLVSYGPPTFRIKAGATTPSITYQTKNVAGDVVPLLDAVSVQFVYRRTKAAPSTAVTRAASFALKDNGELRYDWTPDDTAVPGNYYAEWRVTKTSGAVEIFPIRNFQLFTIEPVLT